MKASIIKIGNSKGIRIPKPVIAQCGFQDEVEIVVEDKTLVIRPVADAPRSHWDAAFEKMAAKGDDELLDAGPMTPNQWDDEEWEWK